MINYVKLTEENIDEVVKAYVDYYNNGEVEKKSLLTK